MKLKCKICSIEEDSGEKFIRHFNLFHRVSSVSRFTCGIEGCVLQFVSEKLFHKHLSDFHQSKPTLAQTGEPVLKCTFPGCDYKCTQKVTLRVHRKRKHYALPTDNEVGTSDCEGAISHSQTFDEPPPKVNIVEKIQSPFETQAKISLRDVIVDKYKHHYLTLRSKFHLPETTLQFLINSQHCLVKESSLLLKEQLVEKLKDRHLSAEDTERIVSLVMEDDPVLEMHAPDGPLRTPYMRKKAFTNGTFPYVAPKSHKLGLNENNSKRKYHTIPMRQSLESMFEDDAVYEQFIQSQDCRSKDGILRDIHDGSLIQSHPAFCDGSKVIGVIFYEDDLEMADGLGSARTKYKMTLVEYCLANLRPWSRTKEGVIKLALAALEKDVAYFGLPKLLEPLIAELKDLEVNGINIRGENVKVVTTMLLGDNLGTHTFIGFLENFSSSAYFCRYCEETRAQWSARWNAALADDDSESESDTDSENESDTENDDSDDESVSETWHDSIEGHGYFEQSEPGPDPPLRKVPYISAPLRTPQSYDHCLNRLEHNPSIGSLKGIVAKCQFNDLNSFHCIGSCPPCYGHDINEGVLSYDVALAVKYFVENYPSVTCDLINRRIQSVKLLGCDRNDRPAKVSMKMKKLRGSAAQNATFLRFLPVYIGDRIDKNDPVWKMILKLIDLCKILSSPATPKLSLAKIKEKIHAYLTIRVQCFGNVKLRCKHHYLEHFDVLIEWFGNLKRVETMPFERKHRFFKNTVHSRKNFINITKTVTEEHQLYVSSLSVDQLVNNYPFTKDAVPMDATDLHPDIKDRAISFFGNDVLSTIPCAEEVCFRGTWYNKGEIVVIDSQNNSKLQLCQIENAFLSGKNAYIAGWCCEGVLLPSLQLYKVIKTSTTVICNLERLLDYVSYPVYKLNGQDIMDTSSDLDFGENEDQGSEGQNAVEEIIAIMKPYLIVKSTETETNLKEKLNDLGVTTLTHLSVLEETDLNGLISIANFRLMMRKFRESNEAGGLRESESVSSLYVVNLEKILDSEFFRQLKKDAEIFTRQERTKLVQNVADSILANVRTISEKYILNVATRIIKNYPTSMGCLMKDNEDLKEASLALKSSILNRITYVRSEQKKRKLLRKRLSLSVDLETENLEGEEEQQEGEEAPKRKRFSKAEEYGLDSERDLPNDLPSSETPKTQEAKRELLANSNSSGESMNFACLMKLMKETYCSQRNDINSGLSMDKMLERWPFIGKQPVLQAHFEYLMDMSVSEAVNEEKTNLFPRLITFFVTETSKKRFGEAKAIPLKLKSFLKRNSNKDDPALLFVTVILCCMTFMKVPTESIFLLFEETTSFDEVQSSANLPADGKPIIAVLGSDLQLLPKAYVLVDNCIISDEQVSLPKALMALLMCHIVFKIQYGSRAAPLLHFIQRKVFNITAEGTRTGRGKTKNGKWQTNPVEKPAVYIDLMKKFQEYCIEWNAHT